MYLQPEFTMGERERAMSSTENLATITNLYPGVNYTFTVTAYNELGPSIPSEPLRVRTLEEG